MVQAQAAGDAPTSEPVVEEQTSSEQVEASTLDKTSSDDSVSESDEH